MTTIVAVRRAVERVVESARMPEEQTLVEVLDRAPSARSETNLEGPHDSVWCVRIHAEGETIALMIPGGDATTAEMNQALAWVSDQYQDWLSETAFAWGQLRPVVVGRLDDAPD